MSISYNDREFIKYILSKLEEKTFIDIYKDRKLEGRLNNILVKTNINTYIPASEECFGFVKNELKRITSFEDEDFKITINNIKKYLNNKGGLL